MGTHNEIIIFNEPFIKNTVWLFAQYIQEVLDYLNHECTAEEFVWISEIIDDIASESKNVRLIQTYASLADQNSVEIKYYNIQSFIKSSMAIAKSWQYDED